MIKSEKAKGTGTRVTVILPDGIITEIDEISNTNFDNRTQTIKNLLLSGLENEKFKKNIILSLQNENKKTLSSVSNVE